MTTDYISESERYYRDSLDGKFCMDCGYDFIEGFCGCIPDDDSEDDSWDDSDSLVSIGWGTDEDYGYYGDSE